MSHFRTLYLLGSLLSTSKSIMSTTRPDLAVLHHRIILWDVKHRGDLPPSVGDTPISIPSSFLNPINFKESFEPPFIVECWEQVRQAYLQEPSRDNPELDVHIETAPGDGTFRGSFAFISTGEDPIWVGDLVLLEGRGVTMLAIADSCSGMGRGRFSVSARCRRTLVFELGSNVKMRKLLS